MRKQLSDIDLGFFDINLSIVQGQGDSSLDSKLALPTVCQYQPGNAAPTLNGNRLQASFSGGSLARIGATIGNPPDAQCPRIQMRIGLGSHHSLR